MTKPRSLARVLSLTVVPLLAVLAMFAAVSVKVKHFPAPTLAKLSPAVQAWHAQGRFLTVHGQRQFRRPPS